MEQIQLTFALADPDMLCMLTSTQMAEIIEKIRRNNDYMAQQESMSYISGYINVICLYDAD